MPTVHLGSKDESVTTLAESDDLLVVRTRSGRPLTRRGPVPSPVSAELDDAVEVVRYPEAGVTVYRVPTDGPVQSLEARKARLRTAPDVRFAGGVLVDPVSREPVLYTENLFLKFVDAMDPEDCERVIREAGLKIKEKVTYADNAYFLEAAEGIGQEVFTVAEQLFQRADVVYCHPELIRPRARKGIFPTQWHLAKTQLNGIEVNAHASVDAAHVVTRGDGITIAIIDDGFDIDHVEFSGPGKIVAPRDATLLTGDPRPKDLFGTGPDDGENHGTACAGVACANGTSGACGVAPQARLMPIRLASGLGSQREADAFVWAADHGADVISCSWGPPDGRWWLPGDPRHNEKVPLPASTRLALDYATSRGRNGRGCIVLFAAGNGNESVDHDGYASYPKVIAVAACNDRGTRSVYSDFGAAVWCAFPSSDFEHPPFQHLAPLTPGIWTTDRSGGAGYNVGQLVAGDAPGNFTNQFGGTSSSCPGAAGVVALVLAMNPRLSWEEVRDLLRRSCDRIDLKGGNYDAAGRSRFYGHGRLNAATAVALAQPAARDAVAIARRFEAPLPDLQTVAFEIDVTESSPVASVTVDLDLRHSYIGDLVVRLTPPVATGIATFTLHNRTGGSTRDLVRQYHAGNTPALAALAGKSCKGKWVLQVTDAAPGDSGTLASFGLDLDLAAPNRSASGAHLARTALRSRYGRARANRKSRSSA